QIGNPTGNGLRGELQVKDVYQSYVHTDKPVKINLSGAEIKRIIERTATALYKEGDTVKYNDHILEPTLMTVWKGFEYTIDLSKPVGSRVNIDNIDLEDSYSVIMTDYLFRHVNKIISESTYERAKKTVIEYMIEELTESKGKYDLEHHFKVI
ncbi:5'-nucleotidase C-terminal domain-containing protein, partial [Mammaliicoccus sciuri]